MTKHEILERVKRGEDSYTQLKVTPIGVGKLASELAAFTDSEGGVILVVASDKCARW